MQLGPTDRHLVAPTPKFTAASYGTPKTRSSKPRKPALLAQHLQVAHQRVNLDVDFCRRRLRGLTELTVFPTLSTLRCVKLDAREMKITRVLLNGIENADYIHNDQLYINDPAAFDTPATCRVSNVRDVCSEDVGVDQHHYLRRMLNYLFGQVEDDLLRAQERPENLNSEELLILLPESLKLHPADTTTQYTPSSMAPTNATPGMGEAALANVTPSLATNVTPHLFRSRTGETYTPIHITVDYEVVNPNNGIHFICPNLADTALWHVYTANSDYNASASCWVPCVDNLLERSIWSLELSIPRSVRVIEAMRNSNDDVERRVSGESDDSLEKPLETPLEPLEPLDLIEKSGMTEEVRNKASDAGDEADVAEPDAETHLRDERAMEVDLDEVETENAPFSATECHSPPNNGALPEKDSRAVESHDDDDEADTVDLFVCTGNANNTKERAHATDDSKKVVSWSVFNPVAAHHIGWCVGAFQSAELTNFVDGNAAAADEDDSYDEFEEIEKDDSSPPATVYFLAHQEEMAKNTCIFASNALQHFLKEYGAYPFSSYGIVFVDGPKYPYNNFAGLSVVTSDVLYPATVIEPMFSITEHILESIACQWSGINIVPQCFNDMWCTIGIAKFMSLQFVRTLMGSNEYHYQIKNKMDEIVRRDIGRRPIGMLMLQAPVSENSLEFVRLKAPVVMYILDRRMTKTDKSFGFSRVLPKVFLQAMSGDLPSGSLSTQHFQYVCEKVVRNRLEAFFKQWVYGCGTPVFSISQKFNKKRSMIEVVIRQTQSQNQRVAHPQATTFVDDAVAYLGDDAAFTVPQTFLGPMTIRVHEADGAPYEHIVDIKNAVVKFDVQYNSRVRRVKKKDELEGGLFTRLGNVLESAEDVQQWRLEEWPKRDEELLDPFEWLRVDTDFEWIATFHVSQPDYMFGAQLQQDRDIAAQIAAIDYFGLHEKPSAVYCTMLTRTLMDTGYFYGVRMGAARALARLLTSTTRFMGSFYLLKAFRDLFCFRDSLVPTSNSFDDFGKYFLQKAIPGYLAGIKDDAGATPRHIRSLLFNLLRYNDNSNNPFLDCFYVSELARALVGSVLLAADDDDAPLDADDRAFVAEVVDELLRLRKLDRWVPSYRAEVSHTCLEQKIALARAALISLPFEELLYMTSLKYAPRIRTLAFRGLFTLGALKNAAILKYFLDVCLLEPATPAFRAGLVQVLVDSVAEVAVRGCPSNLDDPEFHAPAPHSAVPAAQGSTVLVENSLDGDLNARRNALARATVKGTIDLLRVDLAHGKGLQHVLWQLMHSSFIGLSERKAVFVLCDILYRPQNKLVMRFPIPCVPVEELRKKIVARDLGDGKIVFKRVGRFKIQLSAKVILSDSKAKFRRSEPRDTLAQASAKLRLRLGASIDASRTSEPQPEPDRHTRRLYHRDRERLVQSDICVEPVAVAEIVEVSGSADEPHKPPVLAPAENAAAAEPASAPAPPATTPLAPLVARGAANLMHLTLRLSPETLRQVPSKQRLAVERQTETLLRLHFTQEKHLARLRALNTPTYFVRIRTGPKSVETSRTPFELLPSAAAEVASPELGAV